MIIVFCLSVFVMMGIMGLFCLVILWLICCVVKEELVNIMACNVDLFRMVFFMVLVLVVSICIICCGKLVLWNSLMVLLVIKGVNVDGLVIMVLFVVNVVEICLVKMVSGKFYGLM